MGRHVSDYASALVTSPKTASTLGHQAFALDASPAHGKPAAAIGLADTSQQSHKASRPQSVKEQLSRHTEHAPTADTIRQGILQVSKHATNTLLALICYCGNIAHSRSHLLLCHDLLHTLNARDAPK